MNEYHVFLVSLDEFCTKEQYTDEQKRLFRETFAEVDALVVKDGMDFISLALYMNYTLDSLKSVKIEAHCHKTIENALDYDFACRIALKEWIPLSAAVLRNFTPHDRLHLEVDKWQGLSELVSDVKQIVKYFLDAQEILLALNPNSPARNSVNDDEVKNEASSI